MQISGKTGHGNFSISWESGDWSREATPWDFFTGVAKRLRGTLVCLMEVAKRLRGILVCFIGVAKRLHGNYDTETL